MLLAIDVGNTQVVLGVFDGEALSGHWRLATVLDATTDALRLQLDGLLRLDEVDPAGVTGVAISSVVPAMTGRLREVAASLAVGPVVVVEPGIRTGMPILIDNPREVGADRVVNSLASREKYGTPVICVDFGTSTNFDVVGSGGEYLGGVIAPGLEIATNALIAGTAALRKVEFVPPRSPIGKGTVEAIQSGAMYGHAGLVDGVIDRLSAELGGEVRTVATGGLASTIVPHCRTVDTIDEFLTLEGLRLIYQLNVDDDQ